MLNRAKSATAAPVHAVTTEKLLEASLTTLETMGRHMHVAGTQSILMGNEHDGMNRVECRKCFMVWRVVVYFGTGGRRCAVHA
jgi:hypothetical protein